MDEKEFPMMTTKAPVASRSQPGTNSVQTRCRKAQAGQLSYSLLISAAPSAPVSTLQTGRGREKQ